jgi:hypothetical protein
VNCAGIETVEIPPWGPSPDAEAETFALTARTKATGPMLISGQRHLRTAEREAWDDLSRQAFG